MDNVIPGLYASTPEPLGFGPSLEIRASLLQRDRGNLLVYRAATLERDVRAVNDLRKAQALSLDQRIELVVQTDDDTRLNALRSGQLDATFIRAPMIPQAEGADLDVMPVPNLNHVHIVVNSSRSEFGDPRVRAAMQHAIDREALTEATFGQEECAPSTQPWAEGYWARHPDMDIDHWEHDPDLARSLLADAGLEDGFSFELLVPNVSAYPPVAEVIQSDLAAVGMVQGLALRRMTAAHWCSRSPTSAASAGCSAPSWSASRPCTSSASTRPARTS
jgi:hypothetical protein